MFPEKAPDVIVSSADYYGTRRKNVLLKVMFVVFAIGTLVTLSAAANDFTAVMPALSTVAQNSEPPPDNGPVDNEVPAEVKLVQQEVIALTTQLVSLQNSVATSADLKGLTQTVVQLENHLETLERQILYLESVSIEQSAITEMNTQVSNLGQQLTTVSLSIEALQKNHKNSAAIDQAQAMVLSQLRVQMIFVVAAVVVFAIGVVVFSLKMVIRLRHRFVMQQLEMTELYTISREQKSIVDAQQQALSHHELFTQDLQKQVIQLNHRLTMWEGKWIKIQPKTSHKPTSIGQ